MPGCSIYRLCTLGIAAVALVGAAPPDLRGIKPGMTLAEAKLALAAAGFLTTPRIFDANWQAKDARQFRYTPYGRNDLEFESGFAVMKRTRPNDWQTGDRVVAVFMPPPSAPRVWGVGQGSVFAPGTGPSARNTVDALVKKYGPPSDSFNLELAPRTGVTRLGWYFDASGKLLGPAVAQTCKQTVHNTYLVNQLSGTSLRAPNVVAEKADWFAGAVKAGCAIGLTAELNFDPATTELSLLEIKLADLAGGYNAAQKTKNLAAARLGGETTAKRKQAEQRKAEF